MDMVNGLIRKYGGIPPDGYLPYAVRDVLGALGENFLHRIGARAAQDSVARDLAESGVSFERLARHFLAGSMPETELRAMPKQMVLARGAGAVEFASAIVGGLAAPAFASFDSVAASILRVLRAVPVQDFKPVSISSLSASDMQPMVEYAPWPLAFLSATGILENVAVQSYGLMLTVSRQAMVDDRQQELAVAFAALGNSAALNLSVRVTLAI